ncbi:LOW QUALITY PROTEIN: meiotic recombination protein SPO11-like [Liolophura sinensis]|uniref:LOW QUALITY PROTEIN: meiotic recombination protein SPO11-like n=1 Tax=Liolophura sinensis TaxID=3198878 RepID=UPI0031582392
MHMMQDARKTHVRFDSPSSTRKFSLILKKVLSIMYRLIQMNSFCTKRDIYYQDTVLFNSQSVVDNIVANISCMLAIPRWELHVLATSKGCVAGDLRFQDTDGNYFDCAATAGLLIPSHVNGIRNLDSQAKFILIVEKDATFQKLIDDDFCHRLHPCILITGKGFPDINTRLLLRKLWEEFAIPIFALVDADPHGMEIMAVYRYGSLALAYESHHLTVPAVRWLGVFPSDITRFKIPKNMLIPVTVADKNKARELLVRPYVISNQIWYHEIQVILQSGVKAEIQCLTGVSPRFLSDIYIPGKLQQGGWI